jgi:hypothetical protein
MTGNTINMTQVKYISVLSFCLFCIEIVCGQEPCLVNAWDAFTKKDYINAIGYADTCIDNFGRRALKIQFTLETDNITPPPVGNKFTEKEKKIIFERGVLNDVGTAYFIKGRSAEYLYKRDNVINITYRQIAIDAYTAACRLRYARTWDERGWFWSPCEASADRLPLE